MIAVAPPASPHRKSLPPAEDFPERGGIFFRVFRIGLNGLEDVPRAVPDGRADIVTVVVDVQFADEELEPLAAVAGFLSGRLRGCGSSSVCSGRISLRHPFPPRFRIPCSGERTSSGDPAAQPEPLRTAGNCSAAAVLGDLPCSRFVALSSWVVASMDCCRRE